MPVSLGSADQFVGFAISMLSMQITKKPFMSDPSVIMYIRIVFGVSALLQIAAALYIRSQINKKTDKTCFKYKPEPSLFNTSESEEVEITIHEYDTMMIDRLFKTGILPFFIVAFINYKWGVLQPLVIQSTGFIRNLFFNPLYRAHIFGMGVLRPFDLNMLFPASEPAPVVEESSAARKKKKED